MTDLRQQLQTYLEESTSPVDIDEVVESRVHPQPATRGTWRETVSRVPRWAYGMAAALLLLLLVGGVALIARMSSVPVIGEGTVPTPATSVTEETTPAPVEIAPLPIPDAPEPVLRVPGWSEVGAGSTLGGGVSDTAVINPAGEGSINSFIAVAPDGTPWVSWWENIAPRVHFEAYVKRFDGNSWEEAGGSGSGGGISNLVSASNDPTLAFALDGTAYAAWWDDAQGNQEIYVKGFNGTSWEEVGEGSASGGGISDTPGPSRSPRMAVAPDGTIYVYWWERTPDGPNAFVKRFNGTSWEEVGEGSASGGGVTNRTGAREGWVSMALAPDGIPYLAWADDATGRFRIFVWMFDGNEWEPVGEGTAAGDGITEYSASQNLGVYITVAPDGMPYVVWSDNHFQGNFEVYVMRFDRTEWLEVGEGSATDGGLISDNNDELSWYASLTVTPEGTPYVTWMERCCHTYGEFGVYVRRFDGTSWVAVGEGSGSGPGISLGPNPSYPFITSALDGTVYLSWNDSAYTETPEIYVASWDS